MKRSATIFCAAALLAGIMAGCNVNEDGSGELGNSGSSAEVSDGAGSLDNSGVSDISESGDSSDSIPEKAKPSGEPTFLVGLDGEPVYTSEITSISVYDPVKEDIVSSDKLDREKLSEAVCEGFTYLYFPRAAVNFMENPELFELSESDGNKFYYYKGEELPDDYEFFRVDVGDKIGGFTVKSARAVFTSGFNGADEFYDSGYVELEGEVELTGYVTVTKESEFYPGSGGNIFFFPDTASSVKVPGLSYNRNFDNGFKARHYVVNDFRGWYGDDSTLWLGNIAEHDCELREGDTYVKVKVILGGIVLDDGITEVDVKNIELI